MNEIAKLYYLISKECIEDNLYQDCELEYHCLREQIRNNMNSKERKKLNKMIECLIKSIKIKNIKSFMSGFSLAMSLNIEDVNKYSKSNTKIIEKIDKLKYLVKNKADEKEIYQEIKNLDEIMKVTIKKL